MAFAQRSGEAGQSGELAQETQLWAESITLVLGEKNDTAPFYVEAVEEAYFRWESDRFTEEERKVLLEKNAVSLLISYLRPIVSGITAASPYPAYNIPYVDLTAND